MGEIKVVRNTRESQVWPQSARTPTQSQFGDACTKGSEPALQVGCCQFDSDRLHQILLVG